MRLIQTNIRIKDRINRNGTEIIGACQKFAKMSNYRVKLHKQQANSNAVCWILFILAWSWVQFSHDLNHKRIRSKLLWKNKKKPISNHNSAHYQGHTICQHCNLFNWILDWICNLFRSNHRNAFYACIYLLALMAWSFDKLEKC